MNLSETSVKRPVLTVVLSIIIVLFGAIGFLYLGVREYPAIDPPIITVRTNYAGANADVIESQITEPLEEQINGIDGIRSITSQSSQGISQITVEFNLEANLEAAANDVRDRVSRAIRQLPSDLTNPPVVTKSDANSDAILSVTVKSDTRDQLQLTDYAVNVLKERLQTIPGVSTINIWGEKKYSMRLWLNPQKMAALNITPTDIKIALDKENIELPSGKIAGNTTELSVRTMGRLETPEDFSELIIKEENGTSIKFKDVGTAILGPENEESILRGSGTPMIGVALNPQPGANYVAIADEFYKRLAQIEKEKPSDISLGIALDNTIFIKKSIHEVEETIIIAFILVVLIIFLFLRDWRSTLIPLLAIPISLIGSFFIMYLAGFSINVLTLLGIVLATGLVVDDAIVVLENIYAKIEAGMEPIEATIKGSKEIFFAIISTTITLAAVFLPIIFLQGFTGALFREFGFVVAGSVIISAFVSLTLTPMMSSKMLRQNHSRSKFYEISERFFISLNNSFESSLNKFMPKKWLTVAIMLLALGLIFLFGSLLQSELAPLEDRSQFRIAATAAEGASYEYMDNYVQKINQFILDSVPENETFLSVTAPGFTGSGAVNSAFIRVALKDPTERKRSQQEISDYIAKQLKNYPEAKTFVIQQQTIQAAGGGIGGLPVQFVIQAENFEKLRESLPKFLDEAQKNSTFAIIDVNLKFNKPELHIDINREKAKDLGVSILDVGQTLQLGLSGQRYGYFIMNGKQYQVIGQLQRENRDDPDDIKNLYIRNNKGELVQLDNIIRIKEESSPPQLFHYNRYNSATVSAALAPGKTIKDGIDAMQQIANKTLDESFSSALAGPSRDFAESSSNTLFAFLLALVLIYLILAAQFESFSDPFIVMLTVPLAMAGALFCLWYFNQTLNIFSQIGIIVLIGLVTKNGILIVEFANQKKEHGLSKFEAAKQAAVSRLRPILMTSLATALGALPIALALGAGSTSRVSLGIVIVGGLLFSTALTLYIIPVMYTIFSKENKSQQIII